MHFQSIFSTLFLILEISFSLLLPISGHNDSNNSLQNDTISHPHPGNDTLLSSVRCGGSALGFDLSMNSCVNAWRKMGRSSDQHRLFPRPSGFFPSIPLKWRMPIRYLSDDGLCAIDVNLGKNSKGDTTSDSDIARIAEAILYQCVEILGESGLGEVPCKSRFMIKEMTRACICFDRKVVARHEHVEPVPCPQRLWRHW